MLNKREIYFILIALCFLLYANSLNNAFISDDIAGIAKNPLISSPLHFWLSPDSLLNSLNYLIAKFNPFIYHLTNIILHSLNTILVFLFLNLFFKTEASFLGACLFAAHPVHTEAVAWVSGRPYIITSIFILCAYFLYSYAAAQSPGRHTPGLKLRAYCLCLLIFTYYVFRNFSFYFVFPFFLILADVTFNRWRKNWKLWIPFFIILILTLLYYRSIISHRILSVAKDINGGGKIIWTNPVYNFTYSFFSHMRLLLWPAKLTLYHEPAVISSFALKAELVFLSLLIIALPFIFRKAKELFFGIGIFVLFLAPTYSPVMVSWLVAERYLYFPSIVLSIVLAFFYERIIVFASRFKLHVSSFTLQPATCSLQRVARYCIIFIIAALGVRTVARNEDWKSPERFWRQTALVSPASPRAHNNMGDVYAQEGNMEGAIREFKKAIEIKPDYADVYHNLANIYHHNGNFTEAIKFYKQAISFEPGLFESHYNLGLIYLNNTRELDLAKIELARAVELRPEDEAARAALGLVMEKQTVK